MGAGSNGKIIFGDCWWLDTSGEGLESDLSDASSLGRQLTPASPSQTGGAFGVDTSWFRSKADALGRRRSNLTAETSAARCKSFLECLSC